MKKIVLFCSERKVNFIIKIIICLSLCLYIGSNAMIDGMKPYYSTRDYSDQIELVTNPDRRETDYSITQEFLAKGTHLNKISLYWAGDPSSEGKFHLSLSNSKGRVLLDRDYTFFDYPVNDWNEIDVSISGLSRDSKYFLTCSTNEKGVELDQGFIELQFTYRYITVASVLVLMGRLLIVALLTVALCYGIFKIEEMYSRFIQTENKQGFLYALYFSVYMIFLFNPIDKLRKDAATFTREIGSGYIQGHDASRIIKNFSIWFVLFAVLFCIYILLSNWFLKKEKTKEQNKIIEFSNKIILLANVNLLFRCVTFFYDESKSDDTFYYSSYLLTGMIVLFSLYVILGMDKWFLAKTYRQLLMSAFGLSFPIAVVLNMEWESGKLILGIQAVLVFVLLIGLLVTRRWIYKLERTIVIDACTIVFSLFPFLTSFYIEIINILNQHSIFIAHPRRCYVVACFSLFVVCFLSVLLAIKKKWKLTWWHNWSGVWLVIGFVCLNQQINLQNIYTPNLFEAANHGVLINGWLRFGEIPLVEHLSHHMMLGVWEGLIYAFLNGDAAGAVVSPYLGYMMVPLALLFYVFIKNIWNEDMALWTTLLFPFYEHWSNFAWGILVAIAVLLFAQKNSYLRATLIWLACVWCALSRADIGVSFGIACCITLFIYIILEKNWKAIKILLYPLIIIGFSGVGLWCILCCIKGISPITRLIEFIKLFAASINWASNNIGNEANTVFSWGYIFVPFMVIVSLIYVVFSKRFRESINQRKWLLLLMLGCAYLTNFPRALTRHSLAEMATQIVFWTAYVYLALLADCIIKQQGVFLLAFTGLILLNTLFVQDENFICKPIADCSVAKLGTFTETWKLGRFSEISDKQEVVQRVQYSDEFQETLAPYEFIFDILLDEDETFIDFIYSSYLYAEFDRRNPVYAAQSPTMLSGELSQEYFIDEIADDLENVPLALMPNNSENHVAMDRIMLNYKYYKVSEFIYQNYRPLCSYDNFSVWCLNDRYDEMAGLLAALPEFSQADSVMDSMMYGDSYFTDNCDMLKNYDLDTFTLVAAESGASLVDFQDAVQLVDYEGKTICITIDYDTSIDGEMTIFYTTDADQDYNEDDCFTCNISGQGVATYEIPVAKCTRLKLTIPENSMVTIKDISLQCQDEWRMINWGYDSKLHSYTSIYSLHRLPLYWAELDEQRAIDNTVLAETERIVSDIYLFDKTRVTDKKNGNYLLLSTNYSGNDIEGLTDNDDEHITATVMVGDYENETFIEKYKYEFMVKEGKHNYLFRVSSDYNWFLDGVNAVRIECSDKLTETEIFILQGD